MIDIQTWTSPEEVAKLVSLSEGKNVLEVGTWLGHTAIAMAQVAEHVTSVDPHLGDKIGPSTYSTFMANISNYKVEDKFTVCVGDLYQHIRNLELQSFDLIFIDAEHTYDAVSLDSGMSYPLLKFGGYLAYHDYDPTNLGRTLTTAIMEFTKGHKMKQVDLVQNLIVFEKV